MATIDRPRLRIEADAVGQNPQAVLTITYTVRYDAYDQASNQQYRESWRLVGVDAHEGGDDDTLQTTPAAQPPVIFGSDGAATARRQIVIQRDLADLDEDPNSTDEIKVEVILTPQLPTTIRELSNRVLVNA